QEVSIAAGRVEVDPGSGSNSCEGDGSIETREDFGAVPQQEAHAVAAGSADARQLNGSTIAGHGRGDERDPRLLGSGEGPSFTVQGDGTGGAFDGREIHLDPPGATVIVVAF